MEDALRMSHARVHGLVAIDYELKSFCNSTFRLRTFNALRTMHIIMARGDVIPSLF